MNKTILTFFDYCQLIYICFLIEIRKYSLRQERSQKFAKVGAHQQRKSLALANGLLALYQCLTWVTFS